MQNLSKQLKSFYNNHIAAHFRSFPNFIILGTMKGGTTSLYNYLSVHPDVCPARAKEVHYFDNNYSRGTTWYRTNFPLKKNMPPGQITGEASPYYMAHPCVPKRIQRLLPDVKLIVLLRNPVERAYSHYQHNRRLNIEEFSFEKALDLEEDRIAGKEQKLLENSKYQSYSHAAFSYKTRGRYAEQLKRWFSCFQPEQMLTLKSEDFFDNPEQITKQVFRFLDLKPCEGIEFKRYNYFGQYSDMPRDTRVQLANYFAPYNQELYDLLGVDYNWQ